MADLEQLKLKYGSVLNAINQMGVRLTHVHVQDNKLYVEGAAGSKEVAEMTGISVNRVYEYNRNLTSILREVEAKMKKENV